MKTIRKPKVMKPSTKIKLKQGFEVSKAERDYLRSLTASINRKRKQIIEKLDSITPQSYLKKKPQTPFAPPKASANMRQFSTRIQLLQRIKALETTKLQLVGNRKLKAEQFLSRSFRKEMRSLNVVFQKLKIGNDLVNRGGLRNQFTKAKAWQYKENLNSAIKSSGLPNANELIQTMNNLTEEEFIIFITENPNITPSYIYHDPDNTRGVKLMNTMARYFGRTIK